MIMLVDFIPFCCANCGRVFGIFVSDWHAHCSHTCECGMHFQYVKTDDLLNASEIDGTLPKYYK